MIREAEIVEGVGGVELVKEDRLVLPALANDLCRAGRATKEAR